MPTLDEISAGTKTEFATAADAGVNTLSNNQTITFTKYVKLILPIDGYVFWVRADILSESALFNASRLNGANYNQTQRTITPAATLVAQGSLHYATRTDQREDETAGINQMVFTALELIEEFNDIGPMELWIGAFEGLKFSFNSRASHYAQSGLHHYRGDAVYPALESQLIDDSAGFDTTNVIVSNSLPLWLKLDRFMPMYPSFLVEENARPPYASVHIEPNSTQAIQSVPRLTRNGSHYQLVKETVKITIYGLRNFNVLDFQDYVFAHSLATDEFGLMDMPVVRDEKRTQSEMAVIAMKKSFTLNVSYYQTRVRDIARQLILKAFLKITPE